MNRLISISENTASLFLLLVALLTSASVAARDLFGIQIPDWFDLSKQFQAIALFWGIAVATHRGSHISVDVIWEHLGPSGKRRLDFFATAIMAAAFAPLAWMVWVKVAGTGSQTTSDLRLPLIPFYGVAAVGATAAFLLAAKRTWDLRSDAAAKATGVAEDIRGS